MKKVLLFLAAVTLSIVNADVIAEWNMTGPDGETVGTVKSKCGKYDAVATSWRGGNLPRFTTGKIHRKKIDAVRFEAKTYGNGSYLSVKDCPELRPGSLTVQVRFKLDRDGEYRSWRALAVKGGNTYSNDTWGIRIVSGAVQARFSSAENKNVFLRGGKTVTDGKWHTATITYDAKTTTASLYVDKDKARTVELGFPLHYTDEPVCIGAYNKHSCCLLGEIAEVKIYDEALKDDELVYSSPALKILDQTYTRVQTGVRPALPRIGTLIPKSVHDMDTERWALGCECLDRDIASWDAYKDLLEPLGIRRIRIQGGWKNSEKEKGVYNFAWLDKIVDDAIGRGLNVCIETSYGNKLYNPDAAYGPGGILPTGKEENDGWDKWVAAMVRHYKPKGVREWMMYNEPNLKSKTNTAERIVENNVRTAGIIKSIDPDAKVAAFVLAGVNYSMMTNMLTQIKAMGKINLIDWAVYHGYAGNPDAIDPSVKNLVNWLETNTPNVKAYQGEAGCASEEVQFALSGVQWTEFSQAKWNIRRMFCDVDCGVDVSLVFTISDLAYSTSFISRYGLIKTNPDNSILKVKTCFYAVQNVVSIFNDDSLLVRDTQYAYFDCPDTNKLHTVTFRDKTTDSDLIVFWDKSARPDERINLEHCTLAIKNTKIKKPVWVDLITGHIYAFQAENFGKTEEGIVLRNVPFYDSPCVVMDADLLEYEPPKVHVSRKKKNVKKVVPTVGVSSDGVVFPQF